MPQAVVMGAAGGIGHAICDELATEYVIVTCRAGPPVEQLASDFEDAGNRYRKAVAWISEGPGGWDVVVNNAGTCHYERFLDRFDEHWLEVIDIKVLAPARLVRLAMPLLHQSPGPRGMNISSKNAFYGEYEYGLSSYDVSKATLTALTRSRGLELGELGILVNPVWPGVIAIESTQETLDDTQASAVYLRQIPLGRFCEPSEVGRAVRFLGSSEFTYTSGSTLLVDGGQLTGDRPESFGASVHESGECERPRAGTAS